MERVLRHAFRRGRLMPPVVVVAVLVVAVAAAPSAAVGAPPGAPSGADGRWTRPVPGAVSRPFVAPASRYGAGHRGADLLAPAGTPVRAAGAGIVVFAGAVAGTLHVVVAHPGDLRTSYSYLAAITVHRGDVVTGGAVVGTAGGTGPDHAPGVLHLGLRLGDDYVDPMLLFGPVDLAEVVHLAPAVGGGPTRGGSWAVEALGVTRGLEPAVRPTGLPGSEPADGGGILGAFGAAVGSVAGSAAGAVVSRLPYARDVGRVLSRLGAAASRATDCTGDAAAADGTGGSGHRLLAVGGIDSSTDPETGATFSLPPERLGYRAGEVSWFSYAPDGGDYAASDTHARIARAARLLAAQLRGMQAREPGREVDLVAHSQGGVVVDEFLQHVYEASDPSYPPIGTVVTLSSPHQGAPAATAAAAIGASDPGAALLGAAAGAGLPAEAPSLIDLREGSRTIRGLWTERLPDQVDFTTIGAVDDVVVPAGQTEVPGATSVVVDPAGVSDHHAVTTDDAALTAVRLALEGRPPPCPDALIALRGAVEPVVISRLEHDAGRVVAGAGQVAEAATSIVGGRP